MFPRITSKDDLIRHRMTKSDVMVRQNLWNDVTDYKVVNMRLHLKRDAELSIRFPGI